MGSKSAPPSSSSNTISMCVEWASSRSFFVLSAFHFGSVDSTETKNLSSEKPLNRSELKIGWW